MTSQAPADTAESVARAYRFQRFSTALLIDDMAFSRQAPGPGDPVPAFDLPTLDGGRFRSDDLGHLPVLLVTCPVTESAGPVLRRLHAQFGDRVRLVLVNTREAHPGDVFGQPQTFEEKWDHATELRRHHDIGFEVAVDDLDGRLHRALTPKPNSAYLLGPHGIIRYRAQWANDERGLRTALTHAAHGRHPARGPSRGMIRPLLRAVGHLPGVIRFAGPRVERDVWIAAPPLALLGGCRGCTPCSLQTGAASPLSQRSPPSPWSSSRRWLPEVCRRTHLARLNRSDNRWPGRGQSAPIRSGHDPQSIFPNGRWGLPSAPGLAARAEPPLRQPGPRGARRRGPVGRADQGAGKRIQGELDGMVQ